MKLSSILSPLLSLTCAACFQGVAGSDASRENELRVVGGTLRVELDPGLPLPPPVVMEWIGRAASAVAGYFGRYPVEHIRILVKEGGSGRVNGGVTYGGARIEIRLGRDTQATDLWQDWMLTHEMFHLGFPSLDDDYSWMTEGLSDYLEPLARARAGQCNAADTWKGFVEGMPQGLPRRGDRGLDGTRSWGRIYWGGCLFWLLADVRIREQTENRRSVDDAIRAISRAGGDGGVHWPLERVLETGDAATGTTVLARLHDEQGSNAVRVDLSALWKRLGVHYDHGAVTFDDSAPLAKVRASMTDPKANP